MPVLWCCRKGDQGFNKTPGDLVDTTHRVPVSGCTDLYQCTSSGCLALNVWRSQVKNPYSRNRSQDNTCCLFSTLRENDGEKNRCVWFELDGTYLGKTKPSFTGCPADKGISWAVKGNLNNKQHWTTITLTFSPVLRTPYWPSQLGSISRKTRRKYKPREMIFGIEFLPRWRMRIEPVKRMRFGWKKKTSGLLQFSFLLEADNSCTGSLVCWKKVLLICLKLRGKVGVAVIS